MLNTDKYTCRMLANVVSKHGVRHAVVSPGSRCAPLIVAFSRHENIELTSVIDERSAAFIALGMAAELDEPVALVCTSGSAVLNYGPALAEAYYRHIPLIAITADRPPEWIDQDDCQTIRQQGALSAVVKYSCSLPCEPPDEEMRKTAFDMADKAVRVALSGCRGPVHINVPLDNPLGNIVEVDDTFDVAPLTEKKAVFSDFFDKEIKDAFRTKRIMFVCGFMQPHSQIKSVFLSISSLSNIVVISDPLANISVTYPAVEISDFDRIAAFKSVNKLIEDESLCPDVVIVLGGSVVSGKLKQYLRTLPSSTRFWHVGLQPWTIDTYLHDAKQIKSSAADFMEHLLELTEGVSYDENSTFSMAWANLRENALLHFDEIIKGCPWDDFKSIITLIEKLDGKTHLHFSNGMSVRYGQYAQLSRLERVDCNRGVSGIDGSTSTAIGASLVTKNPVVLFTGDMSAQYDLGALAFGEIPPNFKMVVICNGDGAIFRNIPSTRNLDELDEYISPPVNLPLRQLANAYGFGYFESTSEESFMNVIDEFINYSSKAILAIKNNPENNKLIHSLMF